VAQACCATTKSARIPNIVHVDVDAFFASVEQVLNPKLRGKPVLGGTRLCGFGELRSEVPRRENGDGFPRSAAHLPESHRRARAIRALRRFCRAVRRILETYTPAVETAALDDFYLDFAGTERLYPDYEATLLRCRRRYAPAPA